MKLGNSFRPNFSLHLRNSNFITTPYRIGKRNMRSTFGLLIPTQLDNLLSTAWIRHHLYMLGYDLFKLKLYQKFSYLLTIGGGGIIKNVVFDLSSFIKKELKPKEYTSSTAKQLRELVYLSSNSSLCLNQLNMEEFKFYSKHTISEFRWFFIAVGYMILSQSENKVEEITNKIIDIYISSRKDRLLDESLLQERSKDQDILNLLKDYYQKVPINYELLYNNDIKYITMNESKDYKIILPPLPEIRNKELLTKSLMHKELYRALLKPEHSFAQELLKHNYDLDPKSYNVIKYDLSFLDGLGDFYLARESSNLLYQFRSIPPYMNDDSFGRKSYNLLRTILSTNTLLSKLALAYNLHQGLNDKIVYNLLKTEYVLNLDNWTDANKNEAKKYEQEFIGDYFECYIGALFLEQPLVAQSFVSKIYQNILFSINDAHRKNGSIKNYNYKAWSIDVIGRSI